MTRWKGALCRDVERAMPPGCGSHGDRAGTQWPCRPVVCLRHSALDCMKFQIGTADLL